MNEGWNNYHKRFHTDGKPKRRCFNDWVEDMKKLSGKTDVSQVDLSDDQIQEAFAERHAAQRAADPLDNPLPAEFWLGAEYAAAECAEGRARESNPQEIDE